MKRKATRKQLKNLARGRKIRAANIRKGKRKTTTKRRKTIPKKRKTIPKKRKMAKRRRTGSVGSSFDLTGGSGDINPQFFSGKTHTVVADQAITYEFQTPISRLPKTGQRIPVMEVLKIFSYITPKSVMAVAQTSFAISQTFGTHDFGTTDTPPYDPKVMVKFEMHSAGAFTPGGSFYATPTFEPLEVDLTDGMGHGVLVATDYIYVQINTVNWAATFVGAFKILYRIKNVALTEYIGIVQSQQ